MSMNYQLLKEAMYSKEQEKKQVTEIEKLRAENQILKTRLHYESLALQAIVLTTRCNTNY